MLAGLVGMVWEWGAAGLRGAVAAPPTVMSKCDIASILCS